MAEAGLNNGMEEKFGWAELLELLDEVLLRERSGVNLWDAKWTESRDAMELYEDFKNAEKPFVEEVERAIESWCASEFNDWPAVSAGAHPLIRLRIETVAQFVSMMLVEKEEEEVSIIPFPDMAAPKVLRWLLIDWWKTNGRDLACDLWIRQKWEEL
jgi:hypothetical protein